MTKQPGQLRAYLRPKMGHRRLLAEGSDGSRLTFKLMKFTQAATLVD